MLLPSRKPSYYYSLLKFVYVTSQLRHALVVTPSYEKAWIRLCFPAERRKSSTVCSLFMPERVKRRYFCTRNESG